MYLDYLTTHTSLSPIQRGFAPGFVNYKKGCTRLAAARDKVYQLLAHGRWFSPGTPASSTTKTGRHDITEILLKVALNTKNQNKINNHDFDLIVTIQRNCIRGLHDGWHRWSWTCLYPSEYLIIIKTLDYMVYTNRTLTISWSYVTVVV